MTSPHYSTSSLLFDLTALLFLAALLLLSLVALSFILHLHDRSLHTQSLQNFTSLWTVRLLLVLLVLLWSLNEIARLPLIRRKYLFPFRQESICQLNVVLSLGFLQPCFLMTLLYLMNASIKKRNPNSLRAIVSVMSLSMPVMCLQIVFVYFAPFSETLPKFMYVSSVVSADLKGERMVLCACPFFSWVVYGGFAVAYGVAFSVSCWRVMAFVINKGLARRINVLATTVMVALPAQIVCLCLSWVWVPETRLYGAMLLAMFLSVAVCMAVAVVLLVVRPIQEALLAGGDYCLWTHDETLRPPREEAEAEHHQPAL
ncbi:uncharacterized protein LOC125209136 [Salvia hispanica]|uniref:uncharacterized protein LOC125209136 n=1 Tax=Salvia hispanica TaxID=49212 RepID=UPI002009B9CC|nr:uncharacterized protein LOC125209136 [Salvia hispanica]